ncbi:MAG: thiolase family protein [Burkholderiales bacterium]|nr:thiolase family protein [Burkholderiales bacterium]
MREVFVVGGGMAPIKAYPLGMGRQVAREAGVAALKDVGCTFQEIDAFYAGVAQANSPRAVAVAKEFGLTGIPVHHIVNASASGLAAAHHAALAIQSGRHDIVLVMGYDLPERAEDPFKAQGFLPPVALFAMWAQRRILETGTRPRHLAMVAAKNWNYARSNPYAARQADHEVTADEVLASKMVAPPLNAMMCTPWVFGAAALVLASREGLRRLPGLRWPIARLAASEAQSEVYGEHHIFEGAVVGPPQITQSTVAAALERAGAGPRDLDVVQVHDAFAIEELVYYELIGLSPAGETERLLEQGAFGPGSRANFGLPEVSTDGGLIARGHPAGPTGVCQLLETLRRFRTHENDRVGMCHLLGAGSTCIVQVLTRTEARP